MRAASAGPTRGSASSSFAVARSTSMGNDGSGAAAAFGGRPLTAPRRPLPVAPLAPGGALASESVARFWRSSASAAAGAGRRPPRAARTRRTTPPARMTADTKTRAMRSAFVGTRRVYRAGRSAPSPNWRKHHQTVAAASGSARPAPAAISGRRLRWSTGSCIVLSSSTEGKENDA
jgi:hypothetical protein